MFNKIKKLSKVVLPFLFLIFAGKVWADPTMSSTLNNSPGVNLTIQSVSNIISGLACWVSQLALILMVVAIIYYGLLFLNSRGSPEKYEKAKKSLQYGLIGIIIILGTYTIIATISNFFGGSATMVPLSCPTSF